MIVLNRRLTGVHQPRLKLILPFHLRQKNRLRITLPNGEEVAVLLPKGGLLRHGDLLVGEQGIIAEVCAADEEVSTVHVRSIKDFGRVCYHLGNRHVALQIGDMWLRYLRDYVLDNMVHGLGLEVVNETKAFEPESGAYSHAH